MFNCLELAINTNYARVETSYTQYIFTYKNSKLYKMLSVFNAIAQRNNTIKGQINYQIKSLTEVLAGHSIYQRYTRQKLQRGENINNLWKLYRSIFSKCMYTSLELAVRSPVVSKTSSLCSLLLKDLRQQATAPSIMSDGLAHGRPSHLQSC
ncbi:hypothetical protein NSMS1_02600 [Nostoc sp. MS1]|nr:hypothetical protein NSMS1_02600 [Nostoc sp. MS1]